MNNQSRLIKEFLSLPPQSFASVWFADPDAAWMDSAWEALRYIAQSSETAMDACGSELVIRADFPSFEKPVVIA